MRVWGAALQINATTPENALNVWARPLTDNSWALVFLNVGAAASDITCDEGCFQMVCK